MRILFLPNFLVIPSGQGDYNEGFSQKPGSNEIGYWFFKYFPESKVEVIQKTAPAPMERLSRELGFEIVQGLKAFLRQKEYDLIVSHSYNSGLVLSFLRSLFGSRTPPHFVIDVGCLNGGVESRWQIPIIRFALRSVAGLIYHSSVNEDFYAKHFRNTKRGFVYFGAETDFFTPLPEAPANDYAISIGTGQRDYQTLLEAWSKIDFPLKIVGRTDLETKGAKNVQLVAKIPIPEFKRQIHNARLVVLPISNVRYSVGQMTLTECMSMGKPIIVSRSYGVLDYVEDGVDCLTYKCGDANDLSTKVASLLKDPKLAARLAEAARAKALLRFNERAMGEGINSFIKSVTGGSNP